MNFSDALTLDAPRKTKDGFLAVRARAARTGVYRYLGSEIDPQNEHGLRDAGIVNVLRDDSTVFDRSAVQSFIGKPITDNHPREAVNAENWRDHARGTIMGAMRDREYLAFDLLLTDASTISKVEAGKRELSNGYAAELEFGQFQAMDGTPCVARQSRITGGNHVALVDAGRAGSECAIKDFAVCDTIPFSLDARGGILTDELISFIKDAAQRAVHHKPKEDRVKVINLDGLSVNITDGQAVEQAIGVLDNKLTEANTAKDKALSDVAVLTTDKQTLEAKVATLEAQLADAKPTPAQLRDAAKAYAQTVEKAKGLGVTVSDEMDEPAIMKAAVLAKIGDAAKDWTDAQFSASFATLSTGVSQPKVLDSIRNPQVTMDGAAIMRAALATRDARQGCAN